MLVRNIWAVGRNYKSHAEELGNEVPSEPLIFLKAGSCILEADERVVLPEGVGDINYEVELGLQFGESLRVERACLALDLTARELQGKLKSKGHPWTKAKSFKNACPIGPFFSVASLLELEGFSFSLSKNGEVVQEGNTSRMIFSLDYMTDYVRAYYPVCAGDILLTGTPAGVGLVEKGDFLSGRGDGGYEVEWSF